MAANRDEEEMDLQHMPVKGHGEYVVVRSFDREKIAAMGGSFNINQLEEVSLYRVEHRYRKVDVVVARDRSRQWCAGFLRGVEALAERTVPRKGRKRS